MDWQEEQRVKLIEEERKTDRLKKVEREKGRFEERKLDERISVAIENLPDREREVFLADEEKKRRLELRSIKENLWRKWRNRREENDQKSGEENELRESDGRKKLDKLEKIIERVKCEERDSEKRREEDRERKRKWRKEKEKEESKMLIREVERVERREKKKQLEEKWALMKWVTGFIEENEVGWKRENVRKTRVSLEEWEMLSENGKREEIIINESKIEKSKRKANSWREWRPPAILSDPDKTYEEQANNEENNQDDEEEKMIKMVLRSPKIEPPQAMSNPPDHPNPPTPQAKKYIQQTLIGFKIRRKNEETCQGDVLSQQRPPQCEGKVAEENPVNVKPPHEEKVRKGNPVNVNEPPKEKAVKLPTVIESPTPKEKVAKGNPVDMSPSPPLKKK